MKKLVSALALSSFLLLGLASVSSAVATGGYSEADTTLPEVLQAADFAALTINSTLNLGEDAYVLESIVSAETQVVAGINYRLTLALTRDGSQELYQVVVFNQPWTQTWKLLSFKAI